MMVTNAACKFKLGAWGCGGPRLMQSARKFYKSPTIIINKSYNHNFATIYVFSHSYSAPEGHVTLHSFSRVTFKATPTI